MKDFNGQTTLQAAMMAWYLIPKVWRAERDSVLDKNGGYVLRGYGEVFRRWGLKRREPIVHPLLHRTDMDGSA